jgi:hypothetical protein
VAVTLEPAEPEWFRRHSSQISGTGLSWVAASGAKGLTSLRIKLADDKQTRKYILRLHFAEPDDVQPGEREFSISVQGQLAVAALDVAKESGGRNRSLVKELTGVVIGDELAIELTPASSAKLKASVISGLEVQAEGW